jgi:hypothetical protein
LQKTAIRQRSANYENRVAILQAAQEAGAGNGRNQANVAEKDFNPNQ